MREYRLCLLGFGRVARRFCEIVAEREQALADAEHVRFRFAAVGTARRGSLVSDPPLTAAELLQLIDAGGDRLPEPVRAGPDLIRSARRVGADVLVESTVTESAGAPVAVGHVRTALTSGLHVVTVNKGPVAWHHDELQELAHEHGRTLRFEGAVMDGIPVFSLVERSLPGVRVQAVGGVLNSTTNYVLDALAEGRTLHDAVADAVSLGFAETEPEHDLAGHDTAAKLAILATVLLGARVTPDEVPRVDVREVTVDRAVAARDAGRRLRILATATRTASGRPDLDVELVEVGPTHPAFAVDAMSSLLVLDTDLAGTVEVVERRGTLTQTAYAVLGDLLHLARDQQP